MKQLLEGEFQCFGFAEFPAFIELLPSDSPSD